MKRPPKKTDLFFTAFSEEATVKSTVQKKEVFEYGDSDLHDDDSVMLSEIYGGDFQKVWKRTHKKWWL